LDAVRRDEQYLKILRGLDQKIHNQAIFGLTGSLTGFWLQGLALDSGRPVLAVTEGIKEARDLARELQAVTGQEVLVLPPRSRLPLGVKAASPEILRQRLEVFTALTGGKVRFLVAPLEAWLQPLIPRPVFQGSLNTVRKRTVLDPDQWVKDLVKMGYVREEIAQAPGQLAVRGGIVDICPHSGGPYRIEFFGDEVDSIRLYDSQTQRSLEAVEQAVIPPAGELVLTEEALYKGVGALKEIMEQDARRPGEAAARRRREVEELLLSLEEGIIPPGTESLLALFYEERDTLLDYLGYPLLVLQEPVRLAEADRSLRQEFQRELADWLNEGLAVPGNEYDIFDRDWLAQKAAALPVISLALLPRKIPGFDPGNMVTVKAQGVPHLMGKPDLLLEEISHWKALGYSIVLMLPEPDQRIRLRDLLRERGWEAVLTDNLAEPPVKGQIYLLPGNLEQGFLWPDLRLALVAASEIYARPRRPAKKIQRKSDGQRLTGLAELKEGDLVVHFQHGIGCYEGIRQMEVGGVKRDYLIVRYAGEDRLYLHTEQVELLQKYVGAEGHHPKLHKLGGGEWNRLKARVKESIEQLAAELLELYAAREALPGHAFGPDTVWQQEFEASFPYEETADQKRAIAEVKADMEKPRPMDRLLCGDVGYGKTEVALRAAFKAVMDSKQVAVLVPTTVLAQQHYRTFRERFSSYPVTVAVLSRFQTPAAQKQVIKALKAGEIDVVIGTHRLLSKDIRFKDLGLVVVDEEQRFGVAHKERLKMLTKTVDVLTMTATPIPRTMAMAMAGARDVSMIETPPEERFPVQTYVMEYNPQLTREVLRRELDRGGQAYVVHNRIGELDRIHAHLTQLVPEARIGLAHGRMPERDLEEVMLGFVEGEYDLLLCTTIVENGLDIANVNTLVVLEADRLGLSQLYQLRGRVGRTSRLAYAYFTYQPDKILSQDAEKRLSAIRQFTQFGAGFKIALRDLEIRGSGNILGPEQHGHMLAVGFDLYMKLLEETVAKLKSGPTAAVMPQPPAEGQGAVLLDLPVSAYFSEAYLPLTGVKMEMYQRLLAARTLAEVRDVTDELLDRFGEPPAEVKNLLFLTEIRLLAGQAAVEKLEARPGGVRFYFRTDFPLKGQQLMELAAKFPHELNFTMSQGLGMDLKTELKDQKLLEKVRQVLQEIITLAGQEAVLV